jgi:uncharacterized membrane protein YkvA (DUF1232 family)
LPAYSSALEIHWIMTINITQATDINASITAELNSFIQNQATGLSTLDLERLTTDLPVLRKRFTRLPLKTYPYLADQLEFLCRFVEDRVVVWGKDLTEQPVAEAAFALLYFQRAIDLIPDPIPDMGVLDDAIIVGMVLRRQEQAFKQSPYANLLWWQEEDVKVEELLSIISPLRVSSFCLAATQRRLA